MSGLLLPDGVVQRNSHMKFDSNTLLRVAMKGICNVVNRHIQSGSIIDKDHLQELEQDNIIRWYRTEIAKTTGHYPKSIPKELKDMCEELCLKPEAYVNSATSTNLCDGLFHLIFRLYFWQI